MWIINKMGAMILQKVYWEQSQIFEKEEEPELIDLLNPYHKMTNHSIFEKPEKTELEKWADKGFSRLAGLYTMIHYGVQQRVSNIMQDEANKEAMKQARETLKKERQEKEAEYLKKMQVLKEKEESLNRTIENALIKQDNEIRALKHELETIERKHKGELEKKDTIINRKEAQLQTLEWSLTEREFKVWENEKWDKWREETHGRKRRFEWR